MLSSFLPFSRGVRVDPHRLRWHRVEQAVVFGHAMRASDDKLGFLFGFFGHFPDAKAANVVFATAAH